MSCRICMLTITNWFHSHGYKKISTEGQMIYQKWLHQVLEAAPPLLKV